MWRNCPTASINNTEERQSLSCDPWCCECSAGCQLAPHNRRSISMRPAIALLPASGVLPVSYHQLLVQPRHLQRNRKFVDSPLEGDGFELSVPRERGYRPELSSVFYVPENVRFCRTNIRSRTRWRLLSSCTRTPNGRLATGGGRDSLSAALTSRE